MTLKLIRVGRLKQLQTERGISGPVELGKLIGRRTNQTSDLLHGRIPFGEKVARSIEEHAGLPLGWLDSPVDGRGDSAKSTAGNTSVSDTAVHVPILRDASAGMPPSDVFVSPLVLTAEWLNRLPHVSSPGNLRFLHASDDGMQPTFSSGDILLIDIGVRQLLRDGVHVIHARGRTHIKRVRIRIDGSAEVSDDSPTARTVETVPMANLKIAGRVVWVWMGKPI